MMSFSTRHQLQYFNLHAQVTTNMKGVVKSMDQAMQSMNLEQMSALMSKFESQFESLDVQASFMDQAMSSTTTMTTPEGQVDQLIAAVADEHGFVNMRSRQNQASWCLLQTGAGAGVERAQRGPEDGGVSGRRAG